MNLSRRRLLGAAGAAATAAALPARGWARGPADWALAVRDVEADLAPRAMRLVHGRLTILASARIAPSEWPFWFGRGRLATQPRAAR